MSSNLYTLVISLIVLVPSTCLVYFKTLITTWWGEKCIVFLLLNDRFNILKELYWRKYLEHIVVIKMTITIHIDELFYALYYNIKKKIITNKYLFGVTRRKKHYILSHTIRCSITNNTPIIRISRCCT